MSGRRWLLVFGGMVAAIAIAAVLLLGGAAGDSETSSQASNAPAPEARSDAPVRSCTERIEGPRVEPDPRRDTQIGPVTFLGLRSAYRDAVNNFHHDPAQLDPMKIITLVRSGTKATLQIPTVEGEWLELRYQPPFTHSQDQIRLEACDRAASPAAQLEECQWRPTRACDGPYTQFNGGFVVRFARADYFGRCAELVIDADGKAYRRPLFTRSPC